MDHEQKSENTFFSAVNITLFLLYVFTNSLFTWKYLEGYPIWMPLIGLVLLPAAAAVILFHKSGSVLRGPHWDTIYVLLVTALAVFLTVIMFQFHPDQIAVGRYPALNDWLDHLMNGQYPYYSPTHPSGFPMIFFIALPFKLIGDIGFLQILGFILFAGFIFHRYRYDVTGRLRLLLVLLIAPAFMYEVAVRSELFTNMTLILIYLNIYNRYNKKGGLWFSILMGLLGGLLLSTRGIVGLIYIIFFGYLSRQDRLNPATTVISVLIGFIVTLAPFIYWNSEYFFKYGPFTIQMGYLPSWLLIISILTAAACSRVVNSMNRVYYATALILFGVVGATFVLTIFKTGFTAAVKGDQFDISYFCFSLPFILAAFHLPGHQA
nr:hypothetical protein [candidate division Zixibacteria bacterium]